jgi:hypothetical protein
MGSARHRRRRQPKAFGAGEVGASAMPSLSALASNSAPSSPSGTGRVRGGWNVSRGSVGRGRARRGRARRAKAIRGVCRRPARDCSCRGNYSTTAETHAYVTITERSDNQYRAPISQAARPKRPLGKRQVIARSPLGLGTKPDTVGPSTGLLWRCTERQWVDTFAGQATGCR